MKKLLLSAIAGLILTACEEPLTASEQQMCEDYNRCWADTSFHKNSTFSPAQKAEICDANAPRGKPYLCH